jgi:hypothetical protein
MRPTTILRLLILMTCAQPYATEQRARCDRSCLADIMSAYLASLVSNDPTALRLADSVRFSEDAVPMRIGEGAWRTVSGRRPYRLDFIDTREGIAAVHAVLEENGAPILFAARLKVVDHTITEIETMVVRNAAEVRSRSGPHLQDPGGQDSRDRGDGVCAAAVLQEWLEPVRQITPRLHRVFRRPARSIVQPEEPLRNNSEPAFLVEVNSCPVRSWER